MIEFKCDLCKEPVRHYHPGDMVLGIHTPMPPKDVKLYANYYTKSTIEPGKVSLSTDEKYLGCFCTECSAKIDKFIDGLKVNE